ncbi:hypothetical protein RvY_14170 [Ramazzottius varieornatus]|uniref:Methyltransferase domain-containing protein n=1 Tax=Ramazzottius varieornatus TaxID=947166 RepID=A0A1D1VQF9_RAMVA|nr:hypothetical protein RvY_14170 [Ramazzottius varieornatus]
MAVCELCGRRLLDGLRATLRPAVWNSRSPPSSLTDRFPVRKFSNSCLFLTKISPQEEMIHQVFEQVADTYDLMNDIMSVGIHRLWKDQFVRTLAPFSITKILDVAGGTGDIAFRLVRSMDETSRRTKKTEAASTTDKPEVEKPQDVTVLDLSESMLEVGKKHALSLNIESQPAENTAAAQVDRKLGEKMADYGTEHHDTLVSRYRDTFGGEKGSLHSYLRWRYVRKL